MKNVTQWGRPRKARENTARSFALCAAVAALGLAILSFGGKDRPLRAEEDAAVEAMLPADRGTEEPGYLNGKWNFWEFVGDSLARAVFGK